MTPMDRRTFLANGARTSAVAAVSGVVGLPRDDASIPAADHSAVAAAATVNPGTLQPFALTVNNSTEPVGVDPDGCSFAWKLGASGGRGARQHGYRITVRRIDPDTSATVWDSGAVTSARQAFIFYGGPKLDGGAAYSWSVRVQDHSGRWSRAVPQAQFVTALREPDWTALWLHPAAPSEQPDQVTYLRRVVRPPAGALARATAFVAAAHTYRFFVNGQQVDFGPSFCFPDEQYSRAVDVTAQVVPGRATCLGVLHRWYGGGKGRPASAPGLLLQLVLVYQDGRRITYGTDGTWKEHAAEWLPSPLRNTQGFDFIEWVDGRAHPDGWATPSYDESGWTPTTVRGPVGTTPFTKLFAQRTDIAEHVVAPVSVRTLANGSVVADFGAIYPARIRVRFEHGMDGRTIPMHVGFVLDPDGHVSTTHGTQSTNLSYSYITRTGDQVFEPLTYIGFRYLQIDDPGEGLSADQIAAVASHATMPDVPMATFATGMPMLNAVWRLNTRSSLYCCQEHFIDTPTREKGQFAWDAANESESVMRTYGDINLSWQGMRDMARSQARYWPDGQINEVYPNGNGASSYPTFTERYAEWLWRYYVATGDVDTVVLLYPSARRVANFLWASRDATTGLLVGLGDPFGGINIFGYDLSVSADTASNILGVNAFTRIAQVGDLAGDSAGAATQRLRAAQLTAAVNARLVRSDGTYVDGLKRDGTQSPHASQESNALALAYGVVPAERVQAVGRYVAGLGLSVSPNHGLELLRGLANAGLYDDMVRTLTHTRVPGWASIVASGGSFVWETWTPSDLVGDSMSHGWGASALVAMHESLLGISFMTPDHDGTVRAAVAPPSGGLNSARGSCPTVAGPIAVDWRRSESALSLHTVIPPNATATVTFPASAPAAVREAGGRLDRAEGVTVVAADGGRVVVSVGSGSYRFTVGPA